MEDFFDGFLGVFICVVIFGFLTLICSNSLRITKLEKYYNNEVCNSCGQIIGD